MHLGGKSAGSGTGRRSAGFRAAAGIGAGALALALLAARPAPAAEAAELVMVEQQGCTYCEQWDAEIGPIYPKTAEGALAPLRRIDIYDRALDELELARAVNFTPTFLLVENGRELARIEGYPGEDFFWGLLGMILQKHLATEEAQSAGAEK